MFPIMFVRYLLGREQYTCGDYPSCTPTIRLAVVDRLTAKEPVELP